MRSSHRFIEILGAILAAFLALGGAACGSDTEANVDCQTSYLTYQTFGRPFIDTWCRGCHGANAFTRQGAPPSINFDTLDEIRAHADRVRAVAGVGATMPPSGGPHPDERALLVDWLGCGTP